MSDPDRRPLEADDFARMEDSWRANGLRVFSALSAATLVTFSVANFASGSPIGGALVASGIPLAVWSWRLANRRPLPEWAAAPVMLYFTAIFAALLATEHAGSAPVMFFGAAPALAIFALGARRGLALAAIFLVMAVATFTLNEHPLPMAYTVRFLVAFVFTAVVTFMYERARERAIAKLTAVQTRVRKLETLLPMCAWCRRLNAEDNGWVSVEEYLSHRSQQVTHGLCPTCATEQIAALEMAEAARSGAGSGR